MGNDMYNDEQLAHAKAMSEIRPVTDDEAREILTHEQHAALVNDLMISAMEDIDLGRNEAGTATLARQSLLVAQFAALRLALETATKGRDGARAAAAMNFDRATAAERERDEARRDLAASHREADRLRHGEAIESDYVCPESLRADKAEAERDAAVALVREVADSGVEFEDQRVRYVAVQIDRETWVAVRALAQKGAPE